MEKSNILKEEEHKFNMESLCYLLDKRAEEANVQMDIIFDFYSVMNTTRFIKSPEMKEKFDFGLYKASEAVKKLNELVVEEKIEQVFDYTKYSVYLCLVNYYNELSRRVLEEERDK